MVGPVIVINFARICVAALTLLWQCVAAHLFLCIVNLVLLRQQKK